MLLFRKVGHCRVHHQVLKILVIIFDSVEDVNARNNLIEEVGKQMPLLKLQSIPKFDPEYMEQVLATFLMKYYISLDDFNVYATKCINLKIGQYKINEFEVDIDIFFNMSPFSILIHLRYDDETANLEILGRNFLEFEEVHEYASGSLGVVLKFQNVEMDYKISELVGQENITELEFMIPSNEKEVFVDFVMPFVDKVSLT